MPTLTLTLTLALTLTLTLTLILTLTPPLTLTTSSSAHYHIPTLTYHALTTGARALGLLDNRGRPKGDDYRPRSYP